MAKSVNPEYKLYHPKWHRARMPIFWWVEQFSYIRFISRELTSLAVGYSAILLVAFVWSLGRGGQSYARFTTFLQSPVALIIHALVFVAVLYHAVTWLHLAPKAMVVRIGHYHLPDRMVLAAHYLGWIAATVLVAWFLRSG